MSWFTRSPFTISLSSTPASAKALIAPAALACRYGLLLCKLAMSWFKGILFFTLSTISLSSTPASAKALIAPAVSACSYEWLFCKLAMSWFKANNNCISFLNSSGMIFSSSIANSFSSAVDCLRTGDDVCASCPTSGFSAAKMRNGSNPSVFTLTPADNTPDDTLELEVFIRTCPGLFVAWKLISAKIGLPLALKSRAAGSTINFPAVVGFIKAKSTSLAINCIPPLK